MATIFLSYKSEEKKLAGDLQACLINKGHQMRFDLTEVLVGDDWRKGLAEALYSSDGMVVLLTKEALLSQFVISEIGAARAVKMARPFFLLPILVESDLRIPEFIDDIQCIRKGERPVEDVASDIDDAITRHFARLRGRTPRIFISHRHKDKALVAALLNVLNTAFQVEKHDIRCTSVHPYRLPAGERTPDRLQAEISRAKAVLGVLTPDTKESSYVLFELGASWGQKVLTFPLLAKGAQQEHIPPPISDRHPIDLTQADDCLQLLDDLEDVTGFSRRQAVDEKVAEAIRLLVEAATVQPVSPAQGPKAQPQK
ncbi:MAG: toll/interleukin-1 receptor domain-containing protein [Thermoanaerobaculia bacterium]